jgi:hypothetical protein
MTVRILCCAKSYANPPALPPGKDGNHLANDPMPFWFTEPSRRQERQQSRANQANQFDEHRAIRKRAERAKQQKEVNAKHRNDLPPCCFLATEQCSAKSDYHDIGC